MLAIPNFLNITLHHCNRKHDVKCIYFCVPRQVHFPTVSSVQLSYVQTAYIPQLTFKFLQSLSCVKKQSNLDAQRLRQKYSKNAFLYSSVVFTCTFTKHIRIQIIYSYSRHESEDKAAP
jgi:hypothetical protein